MLNDLLNKQLTKGTSYWYTYLMNLDQMEVSINYRDDNYKNKTLILRKKSHIFLSTSIYC